MTSEATVPEAAVGAAWDAYQFHLPIHLRGDDFPAPMRTVLRAALAAALPHLSTAIRDAALEEAAKIADLMVFTPISDGAGIETQSDAAYHMAAKIRDTIRALKGKSIPAPANAALEEETRFLIERLDELEQTISSGEPAEEIYREFNGHVTPSIARLRSALKSIPAPAEGNEAEAAKPIGFVNSRAIADNRHGASAVMSFTNGAGFVIPVYAGQPPSAVPAQEPEELVKRLRHFRNTLLVNASREETSDWCRQTLTDAIVALARQEQRGAVEVKPGHIKPGHFSIFDRGAEYLAPPAAFSTLMAHGLLARVADKMFQLSTADELKADPGSAGVNVHDPAAVLSAIRAALATTPVHQEAGE